MLMRRAHQQAGLAVIMVLLVIFVFVAAATFVLLAVDRNTDLQAAFQRTTAGFAAAEAGVHVGAAGVLTAMQNFGLPTNCSPQALTINGRTVTYTLSVPGGTPGSCAETPVTRIEPAGGVFDGLNAIVYLYDLASTAVNNLSGFTEATVNSRFESHLIAMFQFAAFYSGDLEVLPAPPMTINGRLHTNGDLYLSSGDCGAAGSGGLNVLGQITITGSQQPGTAPLNRGRKDSSENANHVWISLDGTPTNMQILGTDAQGSTGCADTAPRQIPQSEIDTWNGRIATGLTNISPPGENTLLCTPWLGGCPAQGGGYWQNANLRIVLDLTAAPQQLVSGTGPSLYPVEVLDQNGDVDPAKTTALQAFMQNVPGAITYSDVPDKGLAPNWDCRVNTDCESAYSDGTKYTTPFPGSPGSPCATARSPRAQITQVNYTNCYDYRYGGFYNWRESKPIMMLNIDWMALEGYNRDQGGVFFDPGVTTNGGLVVFLSVKGPSASGANNYGVRLYDAARVRWGSGNAGVAFASDQAMYITGNVNCRAPDTSAGTSVPAQCGEDPTDRKPASVAADTINVLSCAWVQQTGGSISPCGNIPADADAWSQICGSSSGGCRPVDENSTQQSGACSGSGCPAQETFVNSAFLAGTDRTWCRPVTGNDTGRGCNDSSWYSGGLENYPRFHENWCPASGCQAFWYQGSFVSVDSPHHTCYAWATPFNPAADDPAYTCATYPRQGFWSLQRYNPPPRRWFYDALFNDAAMLPPLTPRFVYHRLVFFTQVFK